MLAMFVKVFEDATAHAQAGPHRGLESMACQEFQVLVGQEADEEARKGLGSKPNICVSVAPTVGLAEMKLFPINVPMAATEDGFHLKPPLAKVLEVWEGRERRKVASR